jgi:PPM family protein phosphatase
VTTVLDLKLLHLDPSGVIVGGLANPTMLAPDPPTSLDGPRFWSASARVRVDVSGLSHPGRVRPNNEDQFFVARLTRSMQTLVTSLSTFDVPDRADEANYLMVVADGMGGHAAGEVASRMAIAELVNLALLLPDWHFRVNDQNRPEMEWRARRLVQQINSMLTERGARNAALRDMGTTLTAARSLGRDLMIVHVGDSRAYLFRNGHLRRLTKDHTYAELLAEAGQLASADARSNLRHILTNVVGGSHDTVDADIDVLPLADGDRVLLCSDGLTDVVEDDTIAKTLSGASASSEACDTLVQLALDGGGPDNITVIVAAYTFPDDQAQTA